MKKNTKYEYKNGTLWKRTMNLEINDIYEKERQIILDSLKIKEQQFIDWNSEKVKERCYIIIRGESLKRIQKSYYAGRMDLGRTTKW